MRGIPTRLNAIAGLIPPAAKVADIGTGDGMLAQYLSESRGCKVIATEVSRAGLALTRERLRGAGSAVELRLGWGLTPIRPGEAEVVVIAGMGSITISSILEKRPCAVQPTHYILQPMERTAYLRQWLYKHGWELVQEDLVQDRRRFYEIIVAKPAPVDGAAGRTPLLADGEVGPLLVAGGHPLLARFLIQKIRQYRYKLALVSKGRRSDQLRAAAGAASVLAELEVLAKQIGAANTSIQKESEGK